MYYNLVRHAKRYYFKYPASSSLVKSHKASGISLRNENKISRRKKITTLSWENKISIIITYFDKASGLGRISISAL
jgi:hypothetical protein